MPRTPPWLLSLLEEHFEELQMLWELRLTAFRDADYEAQDLRELDERIAAHVDGLVVNQQHALPMITEGLSSSERAVAFAAVFALLSMQEPNLLGQLWESLDSVEGEAADGWVDAFGCCWLDACQQPLFERLEHPSGMVATVAAQSLALVGKLPADHPRVAGLLLDDDADVRRRGWEIVGLLGR